MVSSFSETVGRRLKVEYLDTSSDTAAVRNSLSKARAALPAAFSRAFNRRSERVWAICSAAVCSPRATQGNNGTSRSGKCLKVGGGFHQASFPSVRRMQHVFHGSKILATVPLAPFQSEEGKRKRNAQRSGNADACSARTTRRDTPASENASRFGTALTAAYSHSISNDPSCLWSRDPLDLRHLKKKCCGAMETT